MRAARERVLDCEGLELAVTTAARLEYVFAADGIGQHSGGAHVPALLSLRRGKEGEGLYAGAEGHSAGSSVGQETALASWGTGKHAAHVCQQCKTVMKRAKQRDDVPGVSFCSVECISAARTLLDSAGPCLSTIMGWPPSPTRELQCLAVTLLANAQASSKSRASLWQFLHHAVFSIQPPLHLVRAAADLDRLLKLHTPSLSQLLVASSASCMHVLNVLSHNVQQVSIIGLADTFISVVLATFSKINHSCCSPNAMLTKSPNPDDDAREVRVSLHILRELAPREQVTICYLVSTHGLGREERQTLLNPLLKGSCCCSSCSLPDDTMMLNKQREGTNALRRAMDANDQAAIFTAIQLLATTPNQDPVCVASLSEVELRIKAGSALIAALRDKEQHTSISPDLVKVGVELLLQASQSLRQYWAGDPNAPVLIAHARELERQITALM